MQNLYTGSAGQAAVMSEFLFRGYNVAVPEVDRGDDLFVVEDANGTLYRIQVKAAIGKSRQRSNGYTAQVAVPMRQLATNYTPELTYVFVLRSESAWRDFVVIPRKDLYELHVIKGVGTATKEGALVLSVRVTPTTVSCSSQSLSSYRGDFSRWPPIKH